MKPMKANKIILIIFCAALLCFFKSGEVLADENKTIDELEPLLYEKLEFKKNTDYLHDVKKTEMKNTIPVKQFNIYFDGRNKLPDRNDSSFLFQHAERGENSTVAARSVELKLFTSGDKETKVQTNTSFQEEESSSNNLLIFIFLSIIVIGIIILFTVFLPKLAQPANGVSRRKDQKPLGEG
ncbi:type VII secretion protein EssA [Psychrobacillus sp. FSL K6-2843]|uniref:type VII secretion protein EssA n=2 Tax=Psychrobacillus TaxID=1221880 RepID=UPI001246C930|nr:type VII secretion protein EssA [Psychrobacillus sp. AK 1817]QGM31118.1 type VII secretion protein EssA [Bacillus sp. N3536]